MGTGFFTAAGGTPTVTGTSDNPGVFDGVDGSQTPNNAKEYYNSEVTVYTKAITYSSGDSVKKVVWSFAMMTWDTGTTTTITLKRDGTTVGSVNFAVPALYKVYVGGAITDDSAAAAGSRSYTLTAINADNLGCEVLGCNIQTIEIA